MRALALSALVLCACSSNSPPNVDHPPHMEAVQEVGMGSSTVYIREVVTQDGNFCIVAASFNGVALQCHIPDTIDKGMRLPP